MTNLRHSCQSRHSHSLRDLDPPSCYKSDTKTPLTVSALDHACLPHVHQRQQSHPRIRRPRQTENLCRVRHAEERAHRIPQAEGMGSTCHRVGERNERSERPCPSSIPLVHFSPLTRSSPAVFRPLKPIMLPLFLPGYRHGLPAIPRSFPLCGGRGRRTIRHIQLISELLPFFPYRRNHTCPSAQQRPVPLPWPARRGSAPTHPEKVIWPSPKMQQRQSSWSHAQAISFQHLRSP